MLNLNHIMNQTHNDFDLRDEDADESEQSEE